MPSEEIMHLGDVGTIIRLNAQEDLTGGTVFKIKYLKPNGATGEWDAEIDPGDSEKAYYVTLADDIDVLGDWRFELYTDIPGWSGHGLITLVVEVREPIEVIP